MGFVQCAKCDQCGKIEPVRLYNLENDPEEVTRRPEDWYILLSPNHGAIDLHFCSGSCLLEWVTTEIVTGHEDIRNSSRM
jgi:hypothetical protein